MSRQQRVVTTAVYRTRVRSAHVRIVWNTTTANPNFVAWQRQTWHVCSCVAMSTSGPHTFQWRTQHIMRRLWTNNNAWLTRTSKGRRNSIDSIIITRVETRQKPSYSTTLSTKKNQKTSPSKCTETRVMMPLSDSGLRPTQTWSWVGLTHGSGLVALGRVGFGPFSV